MKTLVDEISGRQDFPVFDGEDELIWLWVRQNLCFFDVNSPDECIISLDGKDIHISSDDDSVYLKIIPVEIIKL